MCHIRVKTKNKIKIIGIQKPDVTHLQNPCKQAEAAPTEYHLTNSRCFLLLKEEIFLRTPSLVMKSDIR